MIEWRVAAFVLLIDQDRMPLRESAALRVLSRQPHVMAFLEQRADRQRLAGRPIDANAVVDRFDAVVEETRDGAVNPETVGRLGDLAADVLEHGGIDASDAATGGLFLIGDLEAGPFAVQPIG